MRRTADRKLREHCRIILGSALLCVGCGQGAGARLPSRDYVGGSSCDKDLQENPFQNPEATHILVADFYSPNPTGQEFAESVSRQIDLELKKFQEEALPNMAVRVPPESVEFQRLHCFVDSHAQADEIAAALGADLVIWGKAYCNASPELQRHISVLQEVHTGLVTGDQAQIGKVEIATPKPYAVCPSATLHRSQAALRKSSKTLDLGSLAHLDLPTLSSTEPFQLVNFALGLHFYERYQYRIAARFFEHSVEYVLSPRDENVATLYGYLGQAFLFLPNGSEQAIEYSKRALAGTAERDSDSSLELRLLSNIARALQQQGRYLEAKDYYERALRIRPEPLPLKASFASLLVDMNRLEEAEAVMRELVVDAEKSDMDASLVAYYLQYLASLLRTRGRFQAAEAFLQRAISVHEQVLASAEGNATSDPEALSDALRAFVGVLLDAERAREAEPIMRRVVALGEKRSDDSARASDLMLLAIILQETQQLPEAERILRSVVGIAERTYGPDHPEFAVQLNLWAGLLGNLNRNAEAESVSRRALKITEEALGKSHPRVARALTSLAVRLQRQHRLDEAEALFRRALAINEERFGADAPRVASSLLDLAFVLEEANRLKEAELVARRALSIDEASLGVQHQTVATDVGSLGRLLRSMDRLAEAEPLMRRALAIQEAGFGPTHTNVAADAAELGELLFDMNRVEEAESLLRRAVAICERTSAADTLRVTRYLSRLATLLHATNRSKDAEALIRRAVAIGEKAPVADTPALTRDLNVLGRLLHETSRTKEAEGVLHRALAIDERRSGSEHSTVGRDLYNLSQLLYETDRPEEAEKFLRRAIEIDAKWFGPNHPNLARDLGLLGMLSKSGRQPSEAERQVQRALAIDQQNFGPTHPSVARDLCVVASVVAQERPRQSQKLLRRSLELFQNRYGSDHPSVAVVQVALARADRGLKPDGEKTRTPFVRWCPSSWR
jgi:tetratricopeptide (TPR) repeat protein